MNKKILDVTVTFLFSICLIVTTNIQEENADRAEKSKKPESTMITAQENNIAVAGVSRVLSEYSFTTESDEKTSIAKNESYRVMAGTLPVQEILQEAHAVKQSEPENEPQSVEQSTAENKGPEPYVQQTREHKYTNRWNITLTEEEIDLLARIVWLESNGEPVSGQEAVVEVIFNRMASELYPNTLYDVLSQKNPTQFCSWKNRDIAKPTEKEYQSIENVLSGNTDILRNDTLYFSTEPLTSGLDIEIGGHSFCY